MVLARADKLVHQQRIAVDGINPEALQSSSFGAHGIWGTDLLILEHPRWAVKGVTMNTVRTRYAPRARRGSPNCQPLRRLATLVTQRSTAPLLGLWDATTVLTIGTGMENASA